MVRTIRKDEVLINSIRYPIIGQVQPVMTSVFPGKVVTGDYSQDDEPEASNVVLSDMRGGSGIEHMDLTTDVNRYWFGNCQTQYAGHLLLPKLATEVTPDTVDAPTNSIQLLTVPDATFESTPSNWAAGEGSIYSSNTHAYQGDKSARVGVGTASGDQTCWAYTVITGVGTDYTPVSFSAWVWCEYTNSARIYIGTHGGSPLWYSDYHPGDSTWHQLTVYGTTTADTDHGDMVPGFEMFVPDATTRYAWFDLATAYCLYNSPTITFANAWDDLYCAVNEILYKLNGTGDGWTSVKTFSYPITDMTYCSIDNTLVVFQGEGYNWWQMTESGSWTEHDDFQGGWKVVDWQGKLVTINHFGETYFTASPMSETLGWTNAGTLNVGLGNIRELFLYTNATNELVVYASVADGMWVWDFATYTWIRTRVTIPAHATSCKSHVMWRDSLFLSSGLDVLQYTTNGTTATLSSVGLNKDGGIPTEYGGQITHITADYNNVYALVDKVYDSNSTYSSLWAYDESGWQCMWQGAYNYGRGLCISSAYAYRLWWAIGDHVYYVPLNTGVLNPHLITTFPYAASGFHVTPIMDMNYQLGDKIWLRLKIDTANCTANESVVVKYRINQDGRTALATGWSTLGTRTSNGVVTYDLNNGVSFNNIQFRFDLARGATTTLSPDVRFVSIAYLKLLPPKWGWRVRVNCKKDYDQFSASQLIAALKYLASATTLVDFVYNDNKTGTEYRYVRLRALQGVETTGEIQEGVYDVFLTEV